MPTKVENNSRLTSNTLFFLLFVCLGMAFYIFHAFLVPILLAMIFVVATYPVYQKFLKVFRGYRMLAALTFCFLSLLILAALVTLIVWLLWGEVFSLKDLAYDQFILQAKWFQAQDWDLFVNENMAKMEVLINKIPYINKTMILDVISNFLQSIPAIAQVISGKMVAIAKLGLGAIWGFLLSLIYFYLASLYFFIDGERALQKVIFLIPIKNQYIMEIKSRFIRLFNSWVVGNILIMIVQGILGGIGFAIAGVPSPVIWGLIITFASLLPFIGTALIFIPATFLLLVSGHYFGGIFLLIWGIAVVGTSDNVVRPFILKGGAHLPLLILFFAIIGGMTTMGFKGLLLGPIVLVFLDSCLHIYSMEYREVLEKMGKG